MGGGTDPLTVSGLQPYTEAALIKGHLSPHNVWRQQRRRWRRLESEGVHGGELGGWGVASGRDRIHGTRKQGGPGTEGTERGRRARDFVHTR